MDNYICLPVHVSNGELRHLSAHVVVACRAFEAMYGTRPGVEVRQIEQLSAGINAGARFANTVSVLAWLKLVPRFDYADARDPQAQVELDCSGSLLYNRYVLWHTRPRAVVTPYDTFHGALPCLTSQLHAAYSLWYAMREGYDAALHSCGGSITGLAAGVWRSPPGGAAPGAECVGQLPVFCIKDMQVCTPSLESGAADGVQRMLGMAAFARLGIRVAQRAVAEAEVEEFDEIVAFSPQGALSLAGCGRAAYFDTVANRIAGVLESLKV